MEVCMLNSVSFGTRMGIYDRANVDAPQAHTRPLAPAAPEKPAKKHKVLKTIAGVIATAAVIAGGLAAGSHFKIFDTAKVGKLLGKVKDATWLQWAKEPAKAALKGLDTAGNAVLTAGKSVYGVASKYVKDGVEFVKGLFAKKTV